MKKFLIAAVLVGAGLGVARVAHSDDTKCCSAKAAKAPGFAQLKKLVGEWRSKMPDGKDGMKSTWAVTAGGSALIETHDGCERGSMVTLYHDDAGTLMLTHYCTAGNQPRMRAAQVTDEAIVFEFKDATNLAEGEPHMHALTIRFVDERHVTEEWTFRAPDGDKKVSIAFERAK